MTFLGEENVQHYYIGEGCASLIKNSLYIRQCLPNLLVNPFAEKAGLRVSAYLSPHCKDISASHALGMWPDCVRCILA